ncbi:MAG: hypothetical protein OXT09_34675, partial [Myxococcales bacterium]|nr:hypothetical protein [Myxococcales bacterium]
RLPRGAIIALGIAATVVAGAFGWRLHGSGSGGLVLTVDPPDARVEVDGVAVRGHGTFRVHDLDSDRPHVVVARAPGHVGWHATVHVKRGDQVQLPKVSLDPEPVVAAPTPEAPAVDERVVEPEVVEHEETEAPRARSRARATAGVGTLRLNTRPWSKVWIDGRPIGNTPQRGITLSAGTHRIRMSNADLGLSKTIRVRVRAGRTETRIIDLME